MRRSYHSTSSPDEHPAAREADQDVHTLIFLDIDGVLNVGVRDDSGGAPLLFSETNVEQARRIERTGRPHSFGDCVEKIVSVSKRELPHGDSGTYSILASTGTRHVSSILVDRLVQIIRACGENHTIVLASSWRRPQHRGRCADLEDEIAKRIGRPFSFDAKTPIRDDNTPEERLKCIGDFLAGPHAPTGSWLRVLVLEDFFITPVNGCWSCEGVRMRSAEDVERYLVHRYKKHQDGVTVKLVHPYEQWKTQRGIVVEVGGGLTLGHLCQAMAFLGAGGGCKHCGDHSSRSSQGTSDASSFESGPANESRAANEDSPADTVGRAKPGKLSRIKIYQKY